MKLVYSQEAIEDLKEMRDFIALHDPSSARRIVDVLIARIDALRTTPALGRPVTQAPDPDVIRDAIFPPYVVRYAAHGKALAILRIWHHRQNRDTADADDIAANTFPSAE